MRRDGYLESVPLIKWDGDSSGENSPVFTAGGSVRSVGSVLKAAEVIKENGGQGHGRQSRNRVSPTGDNFKNFAESGDYEYIPVYSEFITDSETPVTAFAKLTEKTGRFLLESVERGEQMGRYSFIGWEPLLTFRGTGAALEITDSQGTMSISDCDPLMELEKKLISLKVAPAPELGKFYGGAVGFLGYDYVRLIEKLPAKNPTTTGTPDLFWVVPKYLARFDHVSHKITIIVLAKIERPGIEESYQGALAELEQVLAKFQTRVHLPPLNRLEGGEDTFLHTSLSKADFEERVRRTKEYIFAGDAFQVVLSQRLWLPFKGDPFLFYRLLRTINPSPYLFYLDIGEFQLAGSSPEVMVRLEGRKVTYKPIAGTRRRGVNPAEDELLKRELLSDEKERAEHVMLVDLGRNDVGRVCKFGSVSVTELMSIENYSHVMHIVSTIHGELLPDYSGVNLLRAVFPAGTLSGAPKIRAMEIIEEMEPIRRGFYGGAVGYLGFNGNLDTCITIRTVFFNENEAHLQVGAGVVADSIPEREYEETMNKAGALLAALARVGRGNDAGHY